MRSFKKKGMGASGRLPGLVGSTSLDEGERKNGEKIPLNFSLKVKHQIPITEWPLPQIALYASADTPMPK